MARVTVEDCIDKVDNRFDLVLAAGQRARQISSGAPLELERDNDKNSVVALREIAEEKILPANLIESIIYSLREIVESDEPEDVDMDILMAGMDQKAPHTSATEARETEAPEQSEVPEA